MLSNVVFLYNFWSTNKKKQTNFMAPFYGWGSTASRLQPLRGGSLSTSKGWKAESTLEPPSGFEHGTPRLGIQRLNWSSPHCLNKEFLLSFKLKNKPAASNTVCYFSTFRRSHPEVLLWKGVLKICSNFTEHPCRSVKVWIVICRWQNHNFVEILENSWNFAQT